MNTTYKTIKSSTLRNNLSDTLDAVEQTKQQILLIQRHGETDAALVNIDFLETILDSNDKKLIAELKRARQQANQGKTATFTEVFGEI